MVDEIHSPPSRRRRRHRRRRRPRSDEQKPEPQQPKEIPLEESETLVLEKGEERRTVEKVDEQNLAPQQPKEMSLEESERLNQDWAATCAIYGASGNVGGDGGEVDSSFSSSGAIATPSSSSSTTSTTTKIYRLPNTGFCATLPISIPTSNVSFFRRVTDDQHYRYFSLAQPPVVTIEFLYTTKKINLHSETDENGSEEDDDDDEEEEFENSPPRSMKLTWGHYPKEWPIDHQGTYLEWIKQNANRLLNDNQMSFCVCEFVEHEALDYWGTSPIPLSSSSLSDYRLVLLPPKMDAMYHKNVGTLLHPKQEARSTKSSSSSSTTARSVEEFAKTTLMEGWKFLYRTDCPICFDTMLYSAGVILPCGHFCCRECLDMYFKIKVTELSTHRTNPFLCPIETCRQDLPIVGFCKQYLSTQDMERVRKWYKDLKFPPCFSLDRCLDSKRCGAMESMRIHKHDQTHVYCDVCHKTWCELCLKRIPEGVTSLEHRNVCDATASLQFCQRYLAASDLKQQECRDRYPWIASYAHSRAHDGEAIRWILENGQCCPKCNTGVERTEGCFHMKCPTCATHFCYECGQLLNPPYYGTHHCWEVNGLDIR